MRRLDEFADASGAKDDLPRPAARRLDEFGDFQTPARLAQQVCQLLAQKGLAPAGLLEPTCGQGALLLAALDQFPTVQSAVGIDINEVYVARLRETLAGGPYAQRVRIVQGDFFTTDWPVIFASLADPLLVLGNPPWVTNAALETAGASNLPPKANHQHLTGLAAVTGKANFDISEWMLTRLLAAGRGRPITLAVLCKTAVARRTLLGAWNAGLPLAEAALYRIDAKAHFAAAVDACLFVCKLGLAGKDLACDVFPALDAKAPEFAFGLREGQLVADIAAHTRTVHLAAPARAEPLYRWRSGIKHDCARVMELRRVGGHFVNGLGEMADLEDDYVYPMVKSSDIANGATLVNGARPDGARWMLVTQRRVGEDTQVIARVAPRTWRYLVAHAPALSARKSTLYKGKAPFAVFGVGDYTFAPWKVAISGLYKRLQFALVGPRDNKPTVLDDTCYFLACRSEDEARLLARLLNSDLAQSFYRAHIFWDAKRPITTEILNRLDLLALARALKSESLLTKHLGTTRGGLVAPADHQLPLF